MIHEEHPEAALDEFMKLLLPIIDKHAPVKKVTDRTVKAPWTDEELKNSMVERDGAKGMANKSGCTYDCKLRNYVTKLNKKTKKLYYEAKINDIKNDGKKCLTTLNDIMSRKTFNSIIYRIRLLVHHKII